MTGDLFRVHGMAFVAAGNSIIGLVVALLGGALAVSFVPVKGDEGATSRISGRGQADAGLWKGSSINQT